MDITPLVSPRHKMIQSYRQGQFKISGEIFKSPVIVCTEKVLVWEVGDEIMMSQQFIDLASEIDVLIIGTGAKFRMLSPLHRKSFQGHGFSCDVMDTGAACRTFNVLNAEGRRVAAALRPTE